MGAIERGLCHEGKIMVAIVWNLVRMTASCGAVILSTLIAASAVFAQGVSVDPTFAPILQDFGSTQNRASVRVSAVQSNGKILVGGNFTVAGGLARSGVARRAAAHRSSECRRLARFGFQPA